MSKWKDEHRRRLENFQRFFSNAEKSAREKWVVRQLLTAIDIDFNEGEVVEGNEPADIIFRSINFQVKEMYDEGRRRTDEPKKELKNLETARELGDLMESYTPKDISFSEVIERCRNFAESYKKYGPQERKSIDMLIYFNLLDYHITPPLEAPKKEMEFRSLSVVSNSYCAVVWAAPDASLLLRENVGKIKKGTE